MNENSKSMRSHDSNAAAGRQRKNLLRATADEDFVDSDTTFNAVLVTSGVARYAIGDTVEVKNYASMYGFDGVKLLIWAYDDGTFELVKTDESLGRIVEMKATEAFAITDADFTGIVVGPGTAITIKNVNVTPAATAWGMHGNNGDSVYGYRVGNTTYQAIQKACT